MQFLHLNLAAIIRVTLLTCMAATAAHAQPAPVAGGPQSDQPPGLAPPDGPHGPDTRGPGGHGPEGAGPLAGLARAEADNAAAGAIAETAHAPRDEVQRMLRAWNLPTVLRYYDIDPPAFRAAVTPRLLALVDTALHDHTITDGDATRLTAQLRQAPPEGPHGPKEPPQPE